MSAAAGFAIANLALEGINIWTLVATRLTEKQQQRAAEGCEITKADIDSLMNAGDVKAALEREELLKAEIARVASGG